MPGKKKASTAGLGALVIKDRFKGQKLRRQLNDTNWVHTSELQDGYDWGRLNLQSITEQSNLDDFLTTAELAGTEFTAEKLNIRVIDPNLHTGLPNKEELAEIHAAHVKHQNLLTIPRRPKWDSSTTPDELEKTERESFLEWRRHYALLQEEIHMLMTPFERNLEVWRQLWRVIERSDVIVQIVDARNPLMFQCPDLEKYVKEVQSTKQNMILVNKADFLTTEQRVAWKKYFTAQDIKVAFWSAKAETDRIQKLHSQNEMDEEVMKNIDEDEEEQEEEQEPMVTTENRFVGISVQETPESVEHTTTNQQELDHMTNQSDVDSSETTSHIDDKCATSTSQSHVTTFKTSQSEEDCSQSHGDSSQSHGDSSQSHGDSSQSECIIVTDGGDSNMNMIESHSEEVESSNISENINQIYLNSEKQPVTSHHGDDDHEQNMDDECKLLTGDELLDLMKSCQRGQNVKEGQTTIGLVGYPNVGKSSTINALLQCKKVQVSSTPGRTKHFQTLYLDPTLCLCDCPGLVMPSFISTKAEMITNGVLPIDQMRDFKPAISLMAQKIPRKVLETTYGMTIIQPKEGEDPNRPPSAMEVANAYAYIRGFMNTKGMPDAHRASRLILKDFVNGRLLYCHPPPGIAPEEFQATDCKVSEPEEGKMKPVIVVSEEGIQYKQHPTNSVDASFFENQSLAGHSKGVHGVRGFSRVNNYRSHTGEGSGDAQQRQMEKPWKKHGNRNKKTKLRKIYGYLDTK